MLLLSLRSAPPRRGVAGWFFLRLSLWLGFAAFLPGLAPLRSARAAEPPDAAQRAALATFFESKIRPVLIDRCVECHGANKQKAGLRLDSAAALKAGGDSGAVVTPGEPDQSSLIQVIRYTGDLKMPPKSKLPDAEIALLIDWVQRGAYWPEEASTGPSTNRATPDEVTDADRAFWAFQTPVEPANPVVHDAGWVQQPLDRFVLSGLEQAGLTPAPKADRATLIRRATFDLHGVPPTPAEVAAFVNDPDPDAFERVVDRLLASPRYGERYGRHWLDVVRYADSNGLDENLAYANAWRYRDWVVSAFNSDLPYDQFVHAQLAGDLLPPADDPHEQLARRVATGFLSLGAKMLAEDDPVKMQMDIIDEQVDTLGRAFLGLTLGCARCHSHKFDPIPIEDYYGLAGIFKSTKTMENFSVVARWQELPLASPEVVAQRAAQQQVIDQRRQQLAARLGEETTRVQGRGRRQLGALLLAAQRRNLQESLLAQTASRGPQPGQPVPAGGVLVEAEDFQRGNVLINRTDYGAGIGVILNKGETPNFVEYDLAIPQAGLYQLEIRYAAAAARPCRLSVAGRQLKGDAAGKVTGSWNPDTQAWHVEALVELPAGPVVVRVECPGPVPHLDKLLLVPVANRPEGWDAPSGGAAEAVAGIEPFLPKFVQALQMPADKRPTWLAGWFAFLERKAKGDANGPDAAKAAPNTPANPPANEPANNAAKAGADALQPRLFAAPVPQTLAELAARYGELAFEAAARWDELQARPETRSLTALADPALETLRSALYDANGLFQPPANLEEAFDTTVRSDLAQRREEIKTLEGALPKFPEAMAVSDGTPENLRVHLRGSHLNLGAQVSRRFPQVFPQVDRHVVGETGSGRLELARWLTDPAQPLTARVMVNRVWQWHFGEALVRSPDNFGRLGERPTHPELLDHLALTLQREGWSLKRLHRRLLLSATWQQGTRFDPRAAQLDPDNRLWWRFNRRRLEAEALRDSVLAVAGSLDSHMGGTLLPTPNRAYVTSTANVNPVVYDPPRRSLYLPVVRSALYDFFQAFDFADPSVQSGRRETTTVAPQALFLMNSDVVLKQTAVLAGQLLADPNRDDAARIGELYQRTLGRAPRTVEIERATQFLARYEQQAAGEPAAVPPRTRAWQSLCRAVLATNEFIYVE